MLRVYNVNTSWSSEIFLYIYPSVKQFCGEFSILGLNNVKINKVTKYDYFVLLQKISSTLTTIISTCFTIFCNNLELIYYAFRSYL